MSMSFRYALRKVDWNKYQSSPMSPWLRVPKSEKVNNLLTR
jgi:hypothetical protein